MSAHLIKLALRLAARPGLNGMLKLHVMRRFLDNGHTGNWLLAELWVAT